MEVIIRTPEKVKKLAHLFHHIKNIINDVNIHFTEDKMYIQGMDNSHACLIEIIHFTDSYSYILNTRN